MRYSRQKELVLNEVLSRCDHPTAEDIFSAVRPICPGISRGTVYRNLNTLVDMGSIRRVGVPGLADRFDRTLEQHSHIYCSCCGTVQDINLNQEALRAVLKSCDGIEMTGYTLTLYGTCSLCKNKN